MTISEIISKMIDYTVSVSDERNHDIYHALNVWGFARTIGELEKLDSDTLFTLEAAAVIHDIACPYCRTKFHNASGKHQEEEGLWIARDFLADTDIPEKQKDRIVYLVSHHHTFNLVDGPDYQILLEADYLVNAEENKYEDASLRSAREHVFKTEAGIRLLDQLYLNK